MKHGAIVETATFNKVNCLGDAGLHQSSDGSNDVADNRTDDAVINRMACGVVGLLPEDRDEAYRVLDLARCIMEVRNCPPAEAEKQMEERHTVTQLVPRLKP